MKLPKPRVVAIDDELHALDAISDALNSTGAACLKLHYSGNIPPEISLDQTRVLFMDLHLSGPAGTQSQNFSTIGGILRDVLPRENGPFVLIIWTIFPNQVDGLMEFLYERLHETPFAIPAHIATLSKIDHIRENRIVNREGLIETINNAIEANPHVAALVNWEARATEAASDTIAAVLDLVGPDKRMPGDLRSELERLLNALATVAVGASNVGKDRFAAVNEALVPILYDRISRLKVNTEDEKLWATAISKPGSNAKLSPSEAAKLNSMLHVEFDTDSATASDRGIVLECPDELITVERFKEVFGVKPETFLAGQLGLSHATESDRFRWVFVQVEAVCDHAQAKPGPLPYLIGVVAPEEAMARPPAAAWKSPTLWIGDTEKSIYLNFRFGTFITDARAKELKMWFRLREALTNEIVAKLHAYGSRPGMIAFRTVDGTGKSNGDPNPTISAGSPQR